MRRVQQLSPRRVRIVIALTIRQPFASAIAYGTKRVENRHRPPGVEPPFELAIHAGGSVWEPSGNEQRAIRQLWPECPNPLELEYSALLAVVTVVGVKGPAGLGPWARGPACWILDNVRPLPRPVWHRGARGLWPVDEDALAVMWTPAPRRPCLVLELGDGDPRLTPESEL